jgi:mono/diheme cytochrome c family protein
MIRRLTLPIAIAVWLAVLAMLKLGVRPPMPASVQLIYMTLTTIGILLFVAANEERFQAFLAPLRAVFEGRAPKAMQALVLAGIPLLLGWGTWLRTAPTWDAPFEPRVVHPEPPANFSLHGKRIETATLENPLRTGDAAQLDKLTAEGKTIYYQNCFFCHGDALAGDGHFANAFSPIPANFRDVGTISMLQESFVFWRVSTGGPGLPKGATPWLSAMPVWQDMLSEEEIWKAILYIYAGSGSTPRTWDEEGDHAKR